jgi:hypothetical protein
MIIGGRKVFSNFILLSLIEIRKRETGYRRVCGPAAAPAFSREKAIGAGG